MRDRLNIRILIIIYTLRSILKLYKKKYDLYIKTVAQKARLK